MVDDRTFFEFSAALIPALVFGGAIGGVRPSRELGAWNNVLGTVLILAVPFLLYAEISAINVSITGEPSGLDRIVVCTAVIALTGAGLGALVAPWVPRSPSRRLTVALFLVIGIGLLAAAVASIRLIDSSLTLAGDEERRAELDDNYEQQERLRQRTIRLSSQLSRNSREESELRGRLATLRESPSSESRPRILLVKDQLSATRRERRGVEIRLLWAGEDLKTLRDDETRLLRELGV